MLLADFKKEIESILSTNLSSDEKEKQLYSLIYENLLKLPPFYQEHYIEDLEYMPKPQWVREKLSTLNSKDEEYNQFGTMIGYKDVFYCNLQSIRPCNEIFINPKVIIGYTWLYDNKFDLIKILQRLPRILLGSSEELPFIFAVKAGKYYICNDGNHRIYAAYLLGRQVKVLCDAEYKDMYDLNGHRI